MSIAGESSGRKSGVVYRLGLVMQMLGAAVLAVLYPLESPFYTTGIMLFELGTLLSIVFFAVQAAWLKRVLLAAVLAGIPLQVSGMLLAPPELAGTVILAGIGLVCFATAGMAGKEAYCFGFKEGWLLAGLLPVTVLMNLFGREHMVLNSVAFSLLFLLLLSLTGKKMRPLETAART